MTFNERAAYKLKNNLGIEVLYLQELADFIFLPDSEKALIGSMIAELSAIYSEAEDQELKTKGNAHIAYIRDKYDNLISADPKHKRILDSYTGCSQEQKVEFIMKQANNDYPNGNRRDWQGPAFLRTLNNAFGVSTEGKKKTAEFTGLLFNYSMHPEDSEKNKETQYRIYPLLAQLGQYRLDSMLSKRKNVLSVKTTPEQTRDL
jgi:hypothetical protein